MMLIWITIISYDKELVNNFMLYKRQNAVSEKVTKMINQRPSLAILSWLDILYIALEIVYRIAQNVGGVKLWQNHSTRVFGR